MAKIIFEFDVKLNEIYLKSVKRCLDCDNRTSFIDYKKPDVCYVSEKKEIPNEGIPEWCPLEDFDDKAIDFIIEQIRKMKREEIMDNYEKLENMSIPLQKINVHTDYDLPPEPVETLILILVNCVIDLHERLKKLEKNK